MPTSSEFRARARQTLGENIFSSAWLYALLVGVIVSVINSIASYTVILALVITGPMSVGVSSYFIKVIRGKTRPEDIGSVFDGFTDGILNNVLLGFLTYVFTLCKVVYICFI